MTQGQGPWGKMHDQDPIPPASADEGPSSAATPTRPGTGIITPMPTSASGPSFEALDMRSVLSRARDASRFESPAEGADTGAGRRRLPVRALLSLGVAAVVLGVAGGALWVSLYREHAVDEQTIVKVSQSPGATIRSPQDTVGGYLRALEAGDIEQALTYGPSPGTGSSVLLTPAAHAGMPESGRPSDITILTTDPLASEVQVSYTLAGQPVSSVMRVTRDDAGSYSLEQTTIEITLRVVSGDNLPTRINGVAVDNRVSLKVVPGTYTPTTGLPFLAFPESGLIPISSLSYGGVAEYVVNPELTPAGHSALVDAAAASLERCIASKELAPQGCPNARRAPKSVVPGSVSWSLLNASTLWQSVTPTLSAADQSIAVATVPLDLRVRMDYTDGSNSGNDDESRNVGIRASMLGTDPGAVSVTWER